MHACIQICIPLCMPSVRQLDVLVNEAIFGLAVQVAAWKMHSKDYTKYWFKETHNYIIKSAASSGLLEIVSNTLSNVVCTHRANNT